MALTKSQVSELYVSIFNRASEGTGNTYWQSTADLATAATAMLNTADAQTYFGTSLDTDQAFIEHIYLNTLNKTYAQDTAGVDYWVGQLATSTRGEVVASLINAVATYATSTDATTKAAYDQFTNRVAVSDNMADTVSAAPTDYATSTSFVTSSNPTGGLTVSNDAATVATANTAVSVIADATVVPTYTIASAATSVTEGGSLVFTVTASAAFASKSTTLNYQISGVSVAGGTASPASDLGKVTGEVTIAAGATTGTITITPTDDGVTEGFEGFKVSLLDSSFATVATSGNVVIKDGAEAGISKALTTSIDALTGTSGGDTFNSVIAGNNATGTTLAAGDNISAGSGTDTLNISISGAAAAGGTTTQAFQATGLEKIIVSNYETAGNANTLDTTLVEGLTTVGMSSSAANGDTVFTGMKSIVDAQMKNGAGDLTVTYTGTIVAGTADVQNVTLGNVSAGTFATNGIETVNISSTLAANTLTNLTNTSMTTLNISGDKNFTITANALNFAGTGAVAGTVDGSTATGKLTLNLATAETTTVTGGSNDDTFSYGTTFATADTINGGAGIDTVNVTGAAGAATFTLNTYTKMTNVEKFVATASNDNLTVATDGYSALTTLGMVEGTGADKTMTANDLAAGVAVELTHVNAQDIGVVTLGLKDASGTADSLNITTKLTSGHATEAIDDLAFTNIETVSITSTAATSTATVTTDINQISDISTDTTLTTLNIAGETNLTASIGAEATKLATINASAFTGILNLTMNATANNNITAGSNDDTIIMGTTLNASDTIDGGGHGSLTTSGDSLTATVTGLTATTGALTISNVEVIDLTNNGTAVINAAGITGASSINLFASSDATTVNGLAEGATIGLGKTASADQVLGTVTVGLATETGSADSVNIGVNEATSATLKATAIETVNLVLSTTDTDIAEATLTVNELNATNITVAGANADSTHTLALGTLDTNTTSLNASSYAGVLTAVTSTAATTVTLKGKNNHDVTGGTGNDTITISTTGSTAAAFNVDGTSGTDTLNVTLGSATLTDTNVDNFDVINYTVDASSNAIVATVTAKGVNDEATKVTVNGGNTLSTFKMGATTAIGAAAGGEATSLVTFDMSSFVGSTLTSFGDSVVDTDLTITGGTGSDTVKASYDTGATEVLKISGVETINLLADRAGTSGETYTFNTAAVTGATTIAVSAGIATADDTTVTVSGIAAGTNVALGYAAVTSGSLQYVVGEFFGTSTLTATLASATGTTDALTIDVVDTDGTTDTTSVASAGVETLTLDVAASAENHKLDISGVAATTGSNTTVNIVDGQASATLEITNAGTTTNAINASTYLGDLTITDRASSAMTITTGAGTDSVKTESTSDVIDLGTGTDTLNVAFQSIGNSITVDMSVAAGADMITLGGTAGTVQANFENISLASFVGTGANVTGSSAANTITGSNYADSINAGLGIDNITGGNGVDYITLTETTASADIVNLTTSTDANNYDQITGFATTSDDIKALQTTFGWNTTDGTTTAVLASNTTLKAADAATDSNIITISTDVITHTFATYMAGTSTYAQLEGTVATAMGATGALDALAVVLVAVDDGSHTGLFKFTSGDAATDDATDVAEIEMIAILNGVSDASALVVGDFVFA